MIACALNAWTLICIARAMVAYIICHPLESAGALRPPLRLHQQVPSRTSAPEVLSSEPSMLKPTGCGRRPCGGRLPASSKHAAEARSHAPISGLQAEKL